MTSYDVILCSGNEDLVIRMDGSRNAEMAVQSPMESVPEVVHASEDVLHSWFTHLDTVFVNTPREYFERHWYADPNRDLEGKDRGK